MPAAARQQPGRLLGRLDGRQRRRVGDADNFARIVADLCATYPNVYCELGYITELLDDPTARELLVANIERARAEAERPPHDFLDKVAYGSDWHMPSMVDNTARYLDVFVDIMNRPPMPRIATCSSTTRRWRT